MSFKEVKCPVCHKMFIPAPQHVYKTPSGKNYICSYHCVLEAERRAEARMGHIREIRIERMKKKEGKAK